MSVHKLWPTLMSWIEYGQVTSRTSSLQYVSDQIHNSILLCLSRCVAAVYGTLGGGGAPLKGFLGGLLSKITPKHN